MARSQVELEVKRALAVCPVPDPLRPERSVQDLGSAQLGGHWREQLTALVLPLCAASATCRNNSVAKSQSRKPRSQGSHLGTDSPHVLSRVRGCWTLATKTFGLLFCNTEHVTSMEFKSLREVGFFMKLPAEEPVEVSV